MPRFPAFLRTYRHTFLAVLATVVLAIGVWAFRGWWRKPDPLLATPVLAIEALQAKSLYFNGPARPWLVLQRPDLLLEEDRDENSERARGLTQAVQNPKLFRQLDRRFRFDAVLLTGDPSQYRPLLDHLVETKDWRLSYADHTSLVFRRDAAKTWEVADLAPVRARLREKPPRDRATALAQTATKLLAAGQPDAGRQLLDEATQLAPKLPDAANGLAIYHLGRAEWREAAAQVERALAADRDFLPALATKTQLLYGTKRYSEAYDLSRQLITLVPEDPGLLFYHAKIAHEAHAYKAEIEALEKLIGLAETAGHPLGGYQVYLGQAYAAAGDAQRSIDSFMLALNDADLPDDQRAFARENVARIKKRTGL
jgi:tetratricopeptide (TPR) repeat protein